MRSCWGRQTVVLAAVMSRTSRSTARWALAAEPQSTGTAGRDSLRVIVLVCIKIRPSAGTCGPCGPSVLGFVVRMDVLEPSV